MSQKQNSTTVSIQIGLNDIIKLCNAHGTVEGWNNGMLRLKGNFSFIEFYFN